MENIVFYFSGTGNCLKAAKTIAAGIGGGEIVSMAKPEYHLRKQYDTIGFVYPTYFGGIPRIVSEFIANLNLGDNKSAYFYIVATCGGFSGGAIYKGYEALRNKHGVKANLVKGVRMFSNYVVLYDMNKNVNALTEKSNQAIDLITGAIKSRKNNKINIFHKLLGALAIKKDFSNMDADYNTNENCTGCGICAAVCPVRNIEIINRKPQFNHKCEHCVACIQFCPQKALNYKNVTQSRGRYTHPEIDYSELAKYNSL